MEDGVLNMFIKAKVGQPKVQRVHLSDMLRTNSYLISLPGPDST